MRRVASNPFNYTSVTAAKNGCDQEAHVFRAATPINESALGSATTALRKPERCNNAAFLGWPVGFP